MRTFHHNLHFTNQLIYNVKGLSDGCPRLLICEPIKSLEDLFYLFFS